MINIITYIHIKIVYIAPDEYLEITAAIDSGRYLPIKLFNSGTVLYFMKVIILKNISIIANAYTKEENLLKNTTTIINNTHHLYNNHFIIIT